MSSHQAASAQKHAFISYVREDREEVDNLQEILEAAGILVWRDTENLWPGEDWKIKIRRAITDGSLAFIACFSKNTEQRESSYQNEELILAVEQMRKMPPGRVWFLPVRFSECELPEFDLGAGRTLDSIQRVDLHGDRQAKNTGRLVASVISILGTTQGTSLGIYTRPTSNNLRDLLLAPEKTIEFEDLIADNLRQVRATLGDESSFSVQATTVSAIPLPEVSRLIANRVEEYTSTISPLINILVLGCTYGTTSQERVWTRIIGEIANADRRNSGATLLLSLIRFPTLAAVYAAGMAALHRGNYGALRSVMFDPIYRDIHGKAPIVAAINPYDVFENMEIAANLLASQMDGSDITDNHLAEFSLGRNRRYTPVSDYLHRRLRGYFSDLIPDNDDYTDLFDLFEVYFGIIGTDAYLQARVQERYVPSPYIGAFSWRRRYQPEPIEQELLREINSSDSTWPPVTAGLFHHSKERAVAAAQDFATRSAEIRSRRF